MRLSDIAAECGVSVVTVAKVLNQSGGSNTRVGAATAKDILAVAERLHYRPNLSARNLRVGTSKLIGVLIDSESVGGLARMLAAIERCADARGYRIMVAEEHDKVSNVIAGYQSFRQYGADGVICISHDYLDASDALYSFFARQPRLVFVGQPRLEKAVYVDGAYAERARLALDFLWNSGRRRIALLIDPAGYLSLDGRREGFVRSLEALGGRMEVNGRIFAVPLSDITMVDIQQAVGTCFERELLDWNCDAVITMCDEYAGFVIREFQARGIRIPDEVAVIGHGNDRFCEILNPALASIDDDQAAQGRTAVELICRMIDPEEEAAVWQEPAPEVRPRLVWRESAGGNPPAELRDERWKR